MKVIEVAKWNLKQWFIIRFVSKEAKRQRIIKNINGNWQIKF